MKKYLNSHNLIRLLIFFIGMFVSSFGVALSTKAALGISPISSLPYVLSEILPFTLGNVTICLHVTFVLGQIILLRRRYKPVMLFQLVLALFYGYFVDFSMWLIDGVNPTTYLEQLLLCLISVFILALGVFMTVRANVIMLAGEGFDMAVSVVTGLEFGKAKILVDCVLVGSAAIISLLYFHTLVGVREGTFIAAVACGLIVQQYNKVYRRIEKVIKEGGNMTEDMGSGGHKIRPDKPHIVVTITREFDPDCIKIAKRLSELTGLKLYDDELVEMMAEESGLDIAFVRKNEEYLTKGLLQMFYANSFKYPYLHQSEPKEDILYRAQQRVIKRIAENEDCIILGRTANRILGKSPYYYHIFLHANPEWRIHETMKEFGLDYEHAAELTYRVDKHRQHHAFRTTGRMWGKAFDYNLCLDIARYSIEDSAEILQDVVTRFVYSPKQEMSCPTA